MFLTELFAYPNSETEQTTDEEDVHRIVDEQIDLEQSIIDAVAMELPMSPLCSDDCRACARSAVCVWRSPTPTTATTSSIRGGPVSPPNSTPSPMTRATERKPTERGRHTVTRTSGTTVRTPLSISRTHLACRSHQTCSRSR